MPHVFAPHEFAPHEFAPHGWEWRWVSWGDAAARVRAAASELAPRAREQTVELGRPPRWAFPGPPRPESLLLDLAIQAVGAIAVPVADTTSVEVGGEVDGWVERPAALDLEHKAPRSPRDPRGRMHDARETAGPEVEVPPGVVVRREAGEPAGVASKDLIAAAGDLATRMASGIEGRDGGAGRDIWISARSLEDPAERLLMAWALRLGAAVVFEPRPGALVPTAGWARPTVFAGDGPEIAALVAAAKAYRSPFPLRWLRRLRRSSMPGLPFDRLHSVVLCRDRELSASVLAFLRERGVRILRPSFGLHPRRRETPPDAATWRTSYNIEVPGEETLGGDP